MADEGKKNTELNAAVAEAVRQALEIAIPTAAKVSADIHHANQPKYAAKRMPTGGQCSTCGQPQFVEGSNLFYACKDKHVKMLVMPQEDQEWFQGVIINGRTYGSFNGNAIDVPAENDIVQILQKWDVQAKQNRKGRERAARQYISNPLGNDGLA